MIKLVVTDMDGSLLSDAKQLPPDFFEVFAELKRRNIFFAVASGRQYYTLVQDFYDIRESVYFMAENGTYVVFRDEVLHVDAIAHENVVELVEQARQIQDAYLILCCKNGAYAESNDIRFLNEARKYYRKLEVVPDATLVKDEVLKVTLCDFRNAEFNSLKYFGKYTDRFKVAVGAERYLDIINPTANKGNALRELQQKLGVTADETLVFGDYLNDLEMMQAAIYSYAMKNAHPEIIQVSNFITEFDNNENGVTQTIRAICLNEQTIAR